MFLQIHRLSSSGPSTQGSRVLNCREPPASRPASDPNLNLERCFPMTDYFSPVTTLPESMLRREMTDCVDL